MGILARLVADGPHPDHADALMLYGQFVGGTWAVEHRFDFDGTGWRHDRREWSFAWTLGGRAVQDVLLPADGPDPARRSGTTVRVYDPALAAWRVQWFGPAGGNFCSLIGRGAGGEIHQDGTDTDGTPLRWHFRDITADSFTWLGWEAAADGGWRLTQEMRARRRREP